MKTYTSYVNDIPRIINNSDSDTTTWAMEMVNDALRYLTTKFYFNERTYTTNTQANVQFYNLPSQVKKLINVTVTIGGILWQARECPSRQFWDSLNTVTNYAQNFPAYFFVFNGQLGLWPIPSSANQTITMNYKTRIVDLIQSDYTTGTVSTPFTATTTGSLASGAVSATLSGSWSLPTGSYQITFSNANTSLGSFTNGSTAVTWPDALTSTATATLTVRSSLNGDIVTGSGTTFAKWMVNNWFMVPYAQANGDQEWYQINTFYDTTHVALDNPYLGGTLSGATYTIGQVPLLPEDYQDLPLYRMGIVYYTTRFPDPNKANLYQKLWDDGEKRLNEEFGSKTSSVALNDTDTVVQNPNLYTRQISQI